MIDLLFALVAASGAQNATAATAPAASAAAAPQRSIESIPGVTVRYYEVTGKKAKDFRKSIAAQRPKSADGSPLAVSNSWTINAGIKKRTENGQCSIESANATFSATVELPRLANPEAVSPAELANWQSYVADLKSEAAARLGFVQDNVDDVERAVAAATCDTAATALNAATARVEAQEQQLAAQRAAAKAAQAQAAPAQQRRPDLYRGTSEGSSGNSVDNPVERPNG